MKFVLSALIVSLMLSSSLPLQAQENKHVCAKKETSEKNEVQSEKAVADDSSLRPEKAVSDSEVLKSEKPASEGDVLRLEQPSSGGDALRMELPTLAPGSGPFTLPGAEEAVSPPHSFSLGASEGHKLSDDDQVIVDKLQKAPIEEIRKKALSSFAEGNYKLAQELYETLCRRDPKNPDNFYGAGDAYAYAGDNPSAFTNFALAWHLADNSNDSRFGDAANNIVQKMQKQVDDQFRLTYGFDSKDPNAVVNAATRMWKAGFTKQSIQLNDYALKNEPLCAHIAAYNLGAIAEHNGDYKQALPYYKWAYNRARLLEQRANSDFTISKTLSLLPSAYIARAVSDTEEALKGNAIGWYGWSQATSYPKHWSSEVCPVCAISRTQAEYEPGQMTLEHAP